ncbi:MAG: argininosuccinate lyase [Deltaproteobacteria bacterium]|nr:argininosuccinate lyase [Deltaproteobacteria bacterium]
MSEKKKKPWSGRFRGATDTLVEEFTASVHFDKRLYRYDIEGSLAHVRMLARQKIIAKKDEKLIVSGLKEILKDIEKGYLVFRPEDEDIHMAIEKALIERIGEAGGKLHTGRSRNDQVSLDVRLYLRDELRQIGEMVAHVKTALAGLAGAEEKTILPGYTHMQKAQPVLLPHYLLAYWEMLDRDEQRLGECHERVNVMPLGSAALAGTSLPIDREYTARLLGFPRVSRNSMDAVSDRDFIAEFVFAASLLMMHLSRFCEDLIIWSTDEFRFVEFSDAFTTGSSIMPQKKNPDVAELIRGKTGRVYGNLVALLTMMKSLPMTYNRDLQEDKEPLFDTVDTLKGCLRIFREMLGNLKFNRDRMWESASTGFSTATDVVEYLVRKGVPFREAHAVVGRLVLHCIDKDKDMDDLTLEEFRKFHRRFGKDVYTCLGVEHAVNSKRSPGGTARELVLKRLKDIAEGKI